MAPAGLVTPLPVDFCIGVRIKLRKNLLIKG
jgi:hypothetical protein